MYQHDQDNVGNAICGNFNYYYDVVGIMTAGFCPTSRFRVRNSHDVVSVSRSQFSRCPLWFIPSLTTPLSIIRRIFINIRIRSVMFRYKNKCWKFSQVNFILSLWSKNFYYKKMINCFLCVAKRKLLEFPIKLHTPLNSICQREFFPNPCPWRNILFIRLFRRFYYEEYTRNNHCAELFHHP